MLSSKESAMHKQTLYSFVILATLSTLSASARE